MAYGSNILTSIFGRRLGLQAMTTAQTGTGQAGRVPEFIVGAEDVRKDVTSETTGTYLKAWGVSVLSTANITGGTTGVFRLDPPIPGIEKTIVWASTGAPATSVKTFVTGSTGGAETFQSTAGSTFTVIASSVGAVLSLMGVTTASWAVLQGTTGSGFTLTTST